MLRGDIQRLATAAESSGDDLKLYIFGSALNTGKYNDVDLLVIYSDIETLRRFKSATSELWLGAPLHLVAMTEAEEKYHNFVGSTKARCIYRG